MTVSAEDTRQKQALALLADAEALVSEVRDDLTRAEVLRCRWALEALREVLLREREV